jgi:UDP-N-acetylglucosamine 4,6-dehydratase
MFNQKTILVTGGTGSFGKRFIEKVLRDFNPKKIIIYSRDELKQYEMQISEKFNALNKNDTLRYFIGDVRDLDRLKMATENCDFVVHAAAMKQVPTAEYNPFEAVKTNVLGGQNVIEAALFNNVKKVIALSTDKAAAPTNLYGATKLTSDKLFIAANNYKGSRDIKFAVVRYGNVMGSRGSVIPSFFKQKKLGKLTITDEKMTRFNITLTDGVDFVLKCLDKMWGGELFVPKIPSYRIIDVAQAVMPNSEYKIIGIRPGEKLHEEMITQTDSMNCIEFKDYYVILPSMNLWDVEKFRLESSSFNGAFCQNEFSYNSGTNNDFLSVEQIKNLIKLNIET